MFCLEKEIFQLLLVVVVVLAIRVAKKKWPNRFQKHSEFLHFVDFVMRGGGGGGWIGCATAAAESVLLHAQ